MSDESKNYFKKLIQGHTSKELKVSQFVDESTSKIQEQLKTGSVKIGNKSQMQLQLDRLKSEKYKKEVLSINSQMEKNEEMYKEAKKELLKQKKLKAQEEKATNQAKSKEIQQKIKKWTELREQLKQRHDQLEKVKRQKELEEEQRIQREEQEKIQFQKLQKKKLIEQRLKELEEQKEARQSIMRNSTIQIKNLHPKYVEMEQRFKRYEQELKFEQEIEKKNHKFALKLDHEGIRAHSKDFMNRLNERKTVNQSEHSPRQAERQQGFKQFFSKDEEKVKSEKEKLKRRKEYQQILKDIPVEVDESKRVKIQIEIDKSKNPKKYNFLGQKALNDFQIYGEFKDFNLNLNSKQIGNEYLKQLPKINQSSRVKKSRSLSHLPEASAMKTSRYKDYLQEFKSQRAESNISKTEAQIRGILRAHKQKDKAFSELKDRMKQYDQQAKRRSKDSELTKGFRGTLDKNKQIDDIYLKSIKTKLACLEML